jgi:hemoglobin-like flavoprotein
LIEVLLMGEAAGRRFYTRLFEVDPSLLASFRGDISEQSFKFMQVMDSAVSGLDRPERFVPIVRQLGRRHVRYCVKSHHYATVGAALLWTLSHCLGTEFTEEVSEAWASAYDLLASTMQRGASDASAALYAGE